MSTEYVIFSDDEVTLSVDESSTKGCLYLESKLCHVGTGYRFTDKDLRKLAVEILQVSAYLSSDPEDTMIEFDRLIKVHGFLGTMERDIT